MGNHINPSSTKRAYTESLPRPKASSPKLAQHRAKYGIKEINNIIHVSKRSDDPETSNQTNKRNWKKGNWNEPRSGYGDNRSEPIELGQRE